MATGISRLLLTPFLIVFMIGGGRVCGCESLSWIGVEVRHSNSSHQGELISCHHHTDGDDHEKDHPGHSHSDPSSDGQGRCCILALKSTNGDIPKKLADLLDPSTLGEFPLASFTELNLLNRSMEAAMKRWRHPSPPVLAASLERVFQQRFNV